ncbi:tetrapyrrole methylase [Suillus clintonianus]|uniref:tetrapyrrole methylase n=1 Tax=Suillus clintonianus TaxID=1904413 RepID=UPI001B878EB0|nr:tetrapyrrole methylase [Suillus clintonianus]KAG2143723.1 tetrapyrrole methylase [Suillus clintonianus]
MPRKEQHIVADYAFKSSPAACDKSSCPGIVNVNPDLQAYAAFASSPTYASALHLYSIGIFSIYPSINNLILFLPPKKGHILLVGSGPGYPSLLTIATHNALTKHTDLVLLDKFVPAAVLALKLQTVEVCIARKFTSNAEGAQSEMVDAAVEATRCRLTVVGLNQGNPVVYGRAGEGVLVFPTHGSESLVVPAVSSAH